MSNHWGEGDDETTDVSDELVPSSDRRDPRGPRHNARRYGCVTGFEWVSVGDGPGTCRCDRCRAARDDVTTLADRMGDGSEDHEDTAHDASSAAYDPASITGETTTTGGP